MIITKAEVTEIKIGQAKVSNSLICDVNFVKAADIPLGKVVEANAVELTKTEENKRPAFVSFDLIKFFTILIPLLIV